MCPSLYILLVFLLRTSYSLATSGVPEGRNDTLRTTSNRRSNGREDFETMVCRMCRGKPCVIETSAGGMGSIYCLCWPPCLHEARCSNRVCQCKPGYSGEDCGIYSAASVEPKCPVACKNGGHCRSFGLEGNHCSCAANFSGAACDLHVTNSTVRCQLECEKRGRVCKPLMHDGEVIDFHCLKADECEKHDQCQHGFCRVNDTNDCICEECWRGRFCDVKCCRKCQNGGRCERTLSGEECICQVKPGLRYSGDFCEKEIRATTVKPQEVEVLAPTYKYILAASGAALFILLVLLGFLPYCLWKKRVVWILKIVYKFQSPVEVGVKEYHAFVSYSGSEKNGMRSPDEQFVLRNLQRKLEDEHGFRLCLHYRDFIPGIPIAENIINAVENSHRTILVLSRRFVESEWCQYEYQKAQHEMLMRRHKILPILLEDIQTLNITDHNLQNILKAVTYIIWPGDEADQKKIQHFWKKLIYSMPKKNPKNLQTYPSTSSEDTELSDLDVQEGLPVP